MAEKRIIELTNEKLSLSDGDYTIVDSENGTYKFKPKRIVDAIPAIDSTLTQTGAAADAKKVGDELTGVKSDLTQITGNVAITEWVDGKFVSTNEATYNPTGAVDNADFRYAFIDCAEGDVFTINGTGGGNPRLWAFADSSNNVLQPKAVANETATDLVITAPANASRLILNDKNKSKESYKGKLISIMVNEANAKTNKNTADLTDYSTKTNTRLSTTDGYITPDINNFELGNITITAAGWTYTNSARRVRTKENYDLELDVGDVIRVKDATKANLYIGYQTTSTSYGATGAWVTEWTCDFGGRYAFVIKATPEETQTDASYLLSQIEIIKYNNIAQRTIINASHNPSLLSANHRGMNRNAPENTLHAFKQSKRYGFDYVETDIAWTSDGVPVLLHDASINRTARNADGTEISNTVNIADITYDQALTYDFGIWKAEKWVGTKIPTFEELLTLCKKQGIKVLAEIKNLGYTSERLIALVDMVKSYGAEDLVCWTSFENTILAVIKNLNAKATLGYLSNSVTSQIISKAQALKTDTNKVILMSASYTEETIGLCKAANIPLWAYTINNANTMKSLPLYLCGVTSDLYPVNIVWSESIGY